MLTILDKSAEDKLCILIIAIPKLRHFIVVNDDDDDDQRP